MTAKFTMVTARTWEEAATSLQEKRWKLPILKAGGMDVVDHLKEGLWEPDAIIDVRRIPGASPDGAAWSRAAEGHEVWTLDAGMTLAQIAAHDGIRKHLAALAQACESAATPQVRNVASLAGNLLQRPRCWYYRMAQFDCLKKGGDRCFAVEGENRYHAVFGGGPCHIVHPSNAAMALWIADAKVHVKGGNREIIPLRDLLHLPESGIRTEHSLAAGEVVTGVSFTSRPVSGFYAVKEKQSFDWPLVAAAAVLSLNGSTIAKAEVCAGAVAPIPWALPAVDQALQGVNLDDDAALRAACARAADGATPMRDNAYKVQLLPVAIRRAILRAAGRPLHA